MPPTVHREKRSPATKGPNSPTQRGMVFTNTTPVAAYRGAVQWREPPPRPAGAAAPAPVVAAPAPVPAPAPLPG